MVDKVKDVNTGAIFARKTIRLPAGRRRTERERIFQNEAKIVRGLVTHYHIIRVFATYYDDLDVYLILEPAADSGDLGRFLEVVRDEMEECNVVDGRQPDKTKVAVLCRAFGCLASGLAFMHRRRIRHQDIKCKNILIHQGSVIYTDFGISGDFSENDGSTTEGPVQFLTRKFSAPEVIDRAPRNSLSDVYSLGCVYFEILAALVAFTVDIEASYSTDIGRLKAHVRDKRYDKYDTLVQTTTSMVLTERDERPTSSQVWEKFRTQPDYACIPCILQEVSLKELPAPALISLANSISAQLSWEFDTSRLSWYYVDHVRWMHTYSNGVGIPILPRTLAQQTAPVAKSDEGVSVADVLSAAANLSIPNNHLLPAMLPASPHYSPLSNSTGASAQESRSVFPAHLRHSDGGVQGAQKMDTKSYGTASIGSSPRYSECYVETLGNQFTEKKEHNAGSLDIKELFRAHERDLQRERSTPKSIGEGHGAESQTNNDGSGPNYTLPRFRGGNYRARTEMLESKFRVRSPGHHFFRIGRVFMALCPESAGFSKLEPTRATTQTSLNEKITTVVRYFVVIREDRFSCTCLSILTYRGKGVAGCRDQSSHAIAYTGDVPPQLTMAELSRQKTELPMGDPIRVISEKPESILNRMSRLNFSKVYTVEHNVEVCSFGRVAEEDLWKLTSQFEKQWTYSIAQIPPPATTPNSGS